MKTVNVSKTDSHPRSLCLFQSGLKAFAVGLESVAEVIEVDRSVRLPHSPPNVLGMCVLRREVIPVLEIAGNLGENAAPSSLAKSTILLLKTTQGIWGVQVGGEGIIVTEERPEDDPARAYEACPGFVRRGETLYTLVDPESTWREIRLSIEKWYSDYWGAAPSSASQPARDPSPR